MTRRFTAPILGLQLLIDIILTLVAVQGAEQLRLHVTLGVEKRVGGVQDFTIAPGVYVLILALWICFFLLFGAFNARRRESLIVDLGNLWLSIGVAMLALASAFYFMALVPPAAPSRLFYVYFFLLDVALLSTAHIVARGVLGALRRRGRYIRRVLLVGSGVQGRHVAVRLWDQKASGARLVGYVGSASEPLVPNLHRFGDLADVLPVVREHAIDEVIIALPASAHQEVLRMHAELQEIDVNVRILLDVFEMVAMRARVEDFHGLPLVSLREPSMNPLQAATKRAFDVVIASVLFVLSLPLLLAFALWVRLDSPGPVLIHQKRMGVGGTVFHMHKFRSMHWDPDNLDAPMGKFRDDPRVTRAGKFLRRTSLDELPQLWNVIIGEMSLVGPRPELPAIAETYEPWQHKRFNVPPGMTGWWQVNGRGERSMHQNTEIDLFYVQNYSILLDLQILVQTVGAVIKGRGAF